MKRPDLSGPVRDAAVADPARAGATLDARGAAVPGERIESPDYALAFRELEPVPSPARRLLIAIHGADGDEWQFADALAGIRDGDVVVLPRGPRTLAGGRTGWFRETVIDGGAHAEPREFDESLQKLCTFVDQVRKRHGVDCVDTVLLGFSQGGALALSAAVTEPACCGAVVVVAGRLPRRIEPLIARPEVLSRLHVLLVHAPDDEVLAPEHAVDAAAFLTAQEMTPAMRFAGRGHDLTADAVQEVREWLHGLPRIEREPDAHA
jgi:phospholipase/carboxylesterase